MKDGDPNTTEGKGLSVCRARLCDGDDDDTETGCWKNGLCAFLKIFFFWPSSLTPWLAASLEHRGDLLRLFFGLTKLKQFSCFFSAVTQCLSLIVMSVGIADLTCPTNIRVSAISLYRDTRESKS